MRARLEQGPSGMTAVSLVIVAISAAVGFVVALIYFAALRVNVRLYLARTTRWRPAILHIARLMGAATFFGLLSIVGPDALVAGLVGFLVARFMAVRSEKRAS